MMLRTIFWVLIWVAISSSLEAVAFQRHTVRNAATRQAVCNDGSPAVYYFRKGSGSGSTNWIIFLGGGGFCYSIPSCNQRSIENPELMTSLDKPSTVRLNGILSDSQTQNPDFYNANQIVIPYCSSDLWSGNRESSGSTGGYEFRGFRILRAIVGDFLAANASPRLSSASRVLLAGTSAGGVGVLVHLDWLVLKLPQAKVFGLNDAGWFPELNLPFPVGLDFLVQQAIALWNGKTDVSCSNANTGNQYRCYLATVYPHLRSPLLVQMSQYDVIVLDALGVHSPFDAAEQAIANLLASEIRSSLEPVSAAFSPRTLTHGVLPYTKFHKLKISGFSLRDITHNWFFNQPGPVKLITE